MFPQPIQNLINQLSKLPDIGPRAATRLVFYFLNQNQIELNSLSQSIQQIKTQIHLCNQCFNLTTRESQLCPICQDPKRNQNQICVVETALNVWPIEKTKQYQGVYHILGGLISPGNGVGPEKLKIDQLINRIKKMKQNPNSQNEQEIIFALSPTTEGDTTYLYIQKMIQPMEIKISRLARGLSTGLDMEYIDENTLTNAFLGRK